jgi:hypothetical protein
MQKVIKHLDHETWKKRIFKTWQNKTAEKCVLPMAASKSKDRQKAG